MRINNHEQTDLQEYLGSYVADESGRLGFHEGPLVQAVRNGWWVVLDELNLAPTEVLEALNRLLDDNRELYVPELQEAIQPHPHFMLFATQNPPGLYSGRKQLSRAFRSRFLELHIDQVTLWHNTPCRTLLAGPSPSNGSHANHNCQGDCHSKCLCVYRQNTPKTFVSCGCGL